MNALTSRNPRKPRRFCGIDIGKNKHVACVIDRDGERIVRAQSFTNDAEGYQRILDRLQEVGGPTKVAIAWKPPATTGTACTTSWSATATTWRCSIRSRRPNRSPRASARRRPTGIDAHHIAVLLKNGEQRPALIPANSA